MNKEDYFISLFDKKHIGDDGAVIKEQVISNDLFCEDIHFKREWMSFYEIAQKSMLVNISDAIVMNAKPKYALIGIKLPKDITYAQMRELNKGFSDVCKSYGMEIIGGDTVAGDKLDISITVISYTKKPAMRKGLKKGHLVAFTGYLGGVKKDLHRALRGEKISRRSRLIKPVLRDKFFYEVSKWISSSLDISDGLSKELSRLSKANRVGFEFFKNIGRSELCSGEEYEVLFGFDERYKNKILSIAKRHKVPLTIFAKAKRGKYKSVCKENHF